MTAVRLDEARRVVAVGLKEAERRGAPSAVIVVNHAKALVAAERMDGSRLLSADVAQRKAETAVSFGVDTKRFCQLVESDVRQLAVFAADPQVKLLWGGVPLTRGEEIVGAVGVSGGTDAQDHAVAEAAAAAFAP